MPKNRKKRPGGPVAAAMVSSPPVTSSSDISLVESRRARPIWDAIERKNYKAALRLCNNILKKYPDCVVAKVQKSLALLRILGDPASLPPSDPRIPEILSLVDQVRDANSKDENVVNAMLIVYRSLNRIEKLTEVFEGAYKEQPNNEDAIKALFFAYIRVKDFTNQQKIATTMFKQYNMREYYYWRVLTVFHQSLFQNRKLLGLADALMKKAHQEDQILKFSELELYMLILKEQEKYHEILGLLESPLGELVKNPVERLDLIAQYQVDSGDHRGALVSFHKLISIHRSCNWKFYVGYLDCLFKILKLEGECKHDDIACYIADARALFSVDQCNIAEFGQHFDISAPMLAQVELHRRLLKEKVPCDAVQIEQILSDTVVKYVLKFGGKSHCVLDLSPALKLLSEVKNDSGVAAFFASFVYDGEMEQGSPCREHILTNSVIYHQLHMVLGLTSNLGSECLRELASRQYQLFLSHVAERKTHGRNRTDICSRTDVDDFALLAVHSLLDLSRKEPAERRNVLFFEAICMLEKALQYQCTNFQIRFTLIGLYIRLGAFEPALQHFFSPKMDVKNVVFETLCHILLDASIRFAFFPKYLQMIQQVISMHIENDQNISDYMVKAYSFASYSKVCEFMELQNRLVNSMVLAQARTEFEHFLFIHPKLRHSSDSTIQVVKEYQGLIIELAQTLPNEAADIGSLSLLIDNNDYSTSTTQQWRSAKDISESPSIILGSTSLYSQCDQGLKRTMILLRRLVLRCISHTARRELRELTEMNSKLRDSLKFFHLSELIVYDDDNCSTDCSAANQLFLTNLWESICTLFDISSTILEISSDVRSSGQDMVQRLTAEVARIADAVVDIWNMIRPQKDSMDECCNYGEIFCCCIQRNILLIGCFVNQFLCLLVALLSIWSFLLPVKKKKRTKSQQDAVDFVNVRLCLRPVVQTVVDALRGVCDFLNEALTVLPKASLGFLRTEDEEVGKTIRGGIVQSYKTTLSNLVGVCEQRLKNVELLDLL